ncbi:hypothetical protein NE237_020783 [Protea cynaroides]|uniref:C3H1-type domain-containing protein n=1 Tax=Protea cynaroides TaxID=273540 RepID=A0A9Q0K490_9MAGN|nr:hypothetical protein NE237_020783 [Protea cynaroides]
MESALKVKSEEEDSTLHITPTSSPSPPLSPASAAAPVLIVETVVADVPHRVSPTDEDEDAPVTVEILEEDIQTIEEELQNIEEEFKSFGLEDNNKYNGDEEDDLKEDIVEVDSLVREAKSRKIFYPQRPDAVDCSYYIRTGTCSYGANCRYNHPARKENQDIIEKEREDISGKMGQQECKYYLRAGGCKFGKACRYNHSREKPMVLPAPPLDFNFLGLPIRLGERECPYYMRTGSCKYGPNCRFHHPDPTAVGGVDISSGSLSLHPSGALQPASKSWPSPPPLNETVPFLDAAHSYGPMMLPPQPVHSNPESNGYQAPAYTPERSIHTPPPTNRTNVSMHNQQHMLDEFPERPGQPECSYFMKTGDCKYRLACKYNHPKNRVSESSACILSPMGLPLRPDQSICTHYHRYGICKFGAACKFDHPVNYAF